MDKALQVDRLVVAAQRRNIASMSDEKLDREWFIVTRCPERPAIREAYIAQMVEEFAKRGLRQPKDERNG